MDQKGQIFFQELEQFFVSNSTNFCR